MKIYLRFILLLCAGAGICSVAGSEGVKTEPETAPPATDAPPEKAEAKLGKWDGFRGIKWLEAPDRKKGVGYGLQLDDRLVYYRRADEKMSIGEAEISRIQYGYYNRRFFQVSVVAEGKENGLALIRATEAQFGKPSEKDAVTESRIWKGKSSAGDAIWVRIDADISLNETNLTMFHVNSLNEMRASKEKALKEKVQKDF